MRATAFRNFKRIIAVLAIVCLMFSLMPANTFAFQATDISGHWAQVKIQSWIDKGLIKGYPDGTFKPDQDITRAEFMALVNRAFGYTAVAPITYTDVKAGSWYAPKVAKAKAAGYISGYPDGTMKPENPITREEVATIVARIKNLTSDANAADKYPDAAKIGSWSKGGVGAVTSAKIMQGYPDGSFKPQGLMTRAEVIVASDNALQYTAPAAPPLTVVTPITSADVAVTKGSIDFLFSFFAGSTTPITFAQAQADLYCLDPPSSTAQLRFGSNDSSPVSSKVQLSALQISPEGKLSYDTFGSMVAAFGGSFQNIPTDIRLSLSCGVDPTISNPWTYDTLWIHFTPEEENVFALYAAPVAPSPSPASAPTPITAIGAISGTPQVGVVLTAGALTPGGATASYQWQISTDGTTYTDIGGATLSTYTPIPGDAGKFIKVVATGTGGYSGNVFTSTQAVTRTDALVSVLPSASSITYGDSISTSTRTGGSASVPGTFTFADGTVKPDAGSYTAVVTFTPSDTGTYNAVTADVNVTVGAKALTITANNASKTYGDTATLAGTAFTVVGLVNSDTVTSVTLASTGSVNTANAGTYAITAIDAVGTGLSNYIISYVPGTLTVNKATPLTITANNASKTYGDTATLAGTAFTVVGLVNSDTVTSVTLASTGSVNTANAGTYAITAIDAVGTGLSNYIISYVPGTLTVNKATPLTITANNASKTYGDTATLAGTAFTVVGLVNSDTVTSVTLASTGSVNTANAGTYAITAIDAVGTGLSNYIISYVPGTLTVNKATPAVVTWPSTNPITYGQLLSASGLNGGQMTYAGQTVPGVVSFITPGTITPTRDVYGNYSAAVVFTPSDTGNYNTVAGRVNVVVNKATLTVTADDKSVTYGDAVPSLTCQITGFVNGETASAVSGTAALSTAYTATTGVASSPVAINVTNGTLAAADYSFIFANASITISKAALTVTADDKSVTYGDAVPSLTCQITGFVNGETASAVSGTAALSTAYTATTGVASSPVAITAAAGTINAANYNFIFVNGAVTINQKPITITADSSTVFYNGSMQSVSGVSSSSLISGDIITASASTSGTNAGTYTSSIAGGVTIWDYSTNVTANYNITLVPGALRIDPRGVTIVAASVSKTYDGTAFTSLSSSVDDSTPLVQNENLVSVTTSGYQINVGSSNDTPNNAVIKRNGVTDVTSNYAITYALGTLTVVSRPITITAASDSKTYDGTALTNAVSTLSGSTPLAANETLDSVTTSGSQLGAGSSDNIPSNAVIKNNGVTDVTTNYVITYVTGTLHVDPRPITVTAVTDTKTYDGTTSSAGMPTLTSGTLVDGHTGIWTQSFASSTAGTGIAIIPSGTISNGGQNVTGNYNITLVNAAGTISAPGGLITLGPNTIRIGSLGGARIQSASFVVTSFNSGHSSQTDLYSLTAYNETTPTGGVILYQNPSNYSLGGGQLTVTYSYSGGASYSVLEFYFYNQDGCLAGYNSTIAHTETYGANADQLAPTETLVGVAPTVAGNDGKITGTTTAMQYKLSTDATYTAVTGTSITGLTAGTYNVRYAAKTGYNAGTNAEVVVGAYVVPFVVATNSSTANDVSTLGIVGTSVGSSAVAVATTDLTTAAGFVTITSVGAGTATITVNDGTNTATIAVTVAADGSITIGTITKYTVVFAAKTNSSTANTKAALGLVGTSVGSSDVPTKPKAALVFAVELFVLAANTTVYFVMVPMVIDPSAATVTAMVAVLVQSLTVIVAVPAPTDVIVTKPAAVVKSVVATATALEPTDVPTMPRVETSFAVELFVATTNGTT